MSQKSWTIDQLKNNGEVSRNQALARFFSRLGAVICDLRKEGWDFETENRNGDYVYKVIKNPEVKPQVVCKPWTEKNHYNMRMF